MGGHRVIKAAIVGCGNIAAAYARDLAAQNVVELAGFYDVDPSRAQAMAAEYDTAAFTTLDAAVDAADLVINLTIFEAHYPVSKAALHAGCHVYSEKPVAMTLPDARELAGLAESNSLRLASAPFTFLGQAQQTAIGRVRGGRLGAVRLVYAEVNHGRIETWHPNPAPFYAAGPILDVGVYPLAFLTATFGPVVELHATASTLLPERTTMTGESFTVTTPDHWLVELHHGSGPTVRMTVNFYAKGDEGIEMHGDQRTLRLHSWFSPDSLVEEAAYGDDFQPVPIACRSRRARLVGRRRRTGRRHQRGPAVPARPRPRRPHGRDPRCHRCLGADRGAGDSGDEFHGS